MLFRALFPGVVLHELAHYFACVLVGVKVFRARLFDANEAFVQHEKPNAWQSFIITLAPFALNSFLGALLLLAANDLVSARNILSLALYWLALSFLFHSFPSSHDAMNSFNAAKEACLKRIEQGSLHSRIAWLFLAPVIFLPILVLVGILLAFDKSPLLKLGYVSIALYFSWQPQQLFSLINNIFI